MNTEAPTADAIRAKMVELFNGFKPELEKYHGYAESVAALSLEYHHARLIETFPGVKIEELAQVVELDARETPTTLDGKLAQLKELPVKKIVFDRTTATYKIYV